MGCDHLDALTLGQVRIQTVTVVGFVADQSRREGVEEAVSEEAVDELAFVRRSAFDTNGERKAVIPGESDDFRSLATFGGPDRSTTIYETSSILRLRAWSVRRDIRFARKQVRSWDALTVTVVPRSLCVGGGHDSGVMKTASVTPTFRAPHCALRNRYVHGAGGVFHDYISVLEIASGRSCIPSTGGVTAVRYVLLTAFLGSDTRLG
jgi:hypothetical protein